MTTEPTPPQSEAVKIEGDWQQGESFPPPAGFAAQANASRCRHLCPRCGRSRTRSGRIGRKQLTWSKPLDTVLEWNPPHAKWFLGGQLNVSVNCVDRHLADTRRQARHRVGGRTGRYADADLSPNSRRKSTSSPMSCASLGVQKGDRVSLYMPMVPEAAIAMLACTRIGAPHSVVFGGFSAESLRERTNDCGAKIIITADGYWRRGQIVPLKQTTDEAVTDCPTVEKVIVLQRIGEQAKITMQAGRDLWWHDLMASASPNCPPEPMDAEDPLFILYTSGSTGKPKGILHTTGGYLTGAYTTTQT